MLQGPGENAGVVDVGDGLAVAFKVESHNHPSAVEPYQGAATGVGGILRDVFAMGARPIAILDSLRLGPLDEDRPRALFRGIVRGVGGYGNCVGVANVGGETVFDDAYRENPLVNAMCLGVLEARALVRASAAGVGNLSCCTAHHRPRRDRRGERAGLPGLRRGERRQAPLRPGRRPVHRQEAARVLARARRKGPRRLAAGPRRGGPRVLDRRDGRQRQRRHRARARPVPLREQGMEPFEVMISESQERMAAVVEPGRLAEVEAVCARWELHCTAIGQVVEGDRLRCLWHGAEVGDIPVEALTDAPRYPLAPERPDSLQDDPIAAHARAAGARRLRRPAAAPVGAERLLQALGLRAVRPARRLGTVVRPGGDAAVVRLTPSERAVAVASTGTAPGWPSTRAAAAARPSPRRS